MWTRNLGKASNYGMRRGEGALDGGGENRTGAGAVPSEHGSLAHRRGRLQGECGGAAQC